MKFRFLATRSGLVVMAGILAAAGSISYAAIRSTTGFDASFMAVEASYGLSILHEAGDTLVPLENLAFGDVVQGERTSAHFIVRNDGNARTRLIFNVRHGTGDGVVFEPTERCAVPGPEVAPRLHSALEDEAARHLRMAHQNIHEELGEIDSEAEETTHQQFHSRLEERLRHLLSEPIEGGEVDGLRHRVAGQKVNVPGLATFCFIVAPHNPDRGPVLAPDGVVGVRVVLHADPNVPANELQVFTILVNAHDLFD